MAWTVGIDAGSTTVKLAVLGPDAEVLHRAARRHEGRPREAIEALLREAAAHPGEGPRGVTGSIGVALAGELRAVPVHEVRAVARAVKHALPAARTVVELGGQDAKLLFLGAGTDDAEMNDRCAAGTGATIDRVARRLGLDPDALGAIELTGDHRVAAKCGVFAETDAVNLVKRGATAEAALSALLRAIVVQNLAVLARGRVLLPGVILLGGPHAHVPALAAAWKEALVSLWRERGVPAGEVSVPTGAAHFGAIGAALHAASGERPLAVVRRAPIAAGARPDPRPRAAGAWPRALVRPGVQDVVLGVDAGSTTSKAVALDAQGRMLTSSYAPAYGEPISDAKRGVEAVLASLAACGIEPRVVSTGVTGYGAELVARAFGADLAVVETSAHAAAAHRVWPDAEVLIDVGGTDVKVVRLAGGTAREVWFSNHCAAGMGAFLAGAARGMGFALSELGERASSARRAPRFTPGCAVFLDTDRVGFLREGYTPEEVLAGLAELVPRNVFEYVLPVPVERLGRRFILGGGVHENHAVVEAMERYLGARMPGAEVRVVPGPGLAGAAGAALLARAAPRANRVRLPIMPERVEVVSGDEAACTRCELRCARSIVRLHTGGEVDELVVGNACERGSDRGSTRRRTSRHAPDLVTEEGARLFRRLLPAPRAPRRGAPVFGIPRVMGLYRAAPLLLHYLRAAGVPGENLIVSPPTTTALFHEGARWAANDPCFPAKLVPAHADWLLRKAIDVLLMPAVTHAAIAVRGTRDTASCPIVAASGHTTLAALGRPELARRGVTTLVPELCLSDRARLEGQLHEAFGPLLGLSVEENRAALEHGIAAQTEHVRRTRRRGEKVLARARQERRAVAVLLARPYHLDPGVNHGVPTEVASRGVAVLGMCALPPSSLDISAWAPAVTNSGCAEKLWAAKAVASEPNLVAIDLSSFRCGQDASILAEVDDLLRASGRPVLRLHDLDEDRPHASLRVRIEAFVEAVHAFERDVLEREEAA